jgi:hypothetical protein
MVLRNIPEAISRIDLLMILILTLTEKPVTFSALVVI